MNDLKSGSNKTAATLKLITKGGFITASVKGPLSTLMRVRSKNCQNCNFKTKKTTLNQG